MFGNINDNINTIQCLAKQIIDISGAEAKSLTPPEDASRALVQFFTDAAGVAAIGVDNMSFTPLATITENGTPTQGFNITEDSCGIHMFNMGIYEIRGFKNLANAKVIPFAEGYNCYCSILYYK